MKRGAVAVGSIASIRKQSIANARWKSDTTCKFWLNLCVNELRISRIANIERRQDNPTGQRQIRRKIGEASLRCRDEGPIAFAGHSKSMDASGDFQISDEANVTRAADTDDPHKADACLRVGPRGRAAGHQHARRRHLLDVPKILVTAALVNSTDDF